MALRLHARRDGRVTLDAPAPTRHHFSPRWVTNALANGQASVSKGRIVVHVDDGDLVYRILAKPGTAVCCGCGEVLDTDGPATTPDQAAPRLAHVAECDAPNDDPNHPAGYRVDMYWDAELVEEG